MYTFQLYAMQDYKVTVCTFLDDFFGLFCGFFFHLNIVLQLLRVSWDIIIINESTYLKYKCCEIIQKIITTLNLIHLAVFSKVIFVKKSVNSSGYFWNTKMFNDMPWQCTHDNVENETTYVRENVAKTKSKTKVRGIKLPLYSKKRKFNETFNSYHIMMMKKRDIRTRFGKQIK